MIFCVMLGNFVAFISTVALCGKLCSWNIMFVPHNVPNPKKW